MDFVDVLACAGAAHHRLQPRVPLEDLVDAVPVLDGHRLCGLRVRGVGPVEDAALGVGQDDRHRRVLEYQPQAELGGHLLGDVLNLRDHQRYVWAVGVDDGG
ncbi:hypothetical protein QOZ89_46665 [Pseudofrankia sp. BMG5.37]|nr:hypothetical protein [Pseudofrankia sp. BMG5.37]